MLPGWECGLEFSVGVLVWVGFGWRGVLLYLGFVLRFLGVVVFRFCGFRLVWIVAF